MKLNITILFLVIVLVTTTKTNAQITISPELAYGHSNATASGDFFFWRNSPITGVDGNKYIHLGLLGNYTIPGSNFIISAGLVLHEYTDIFALNSCRVISKHPLKKEVLFLEFL